MMLVRISDGYASCVVVVPFEVGKSDAREQALEAAFAEEYFTPNQTPELQGECLDPKERLIIDFDGVTVTLTVNAWCAVYDGVITKPQVLSRSEY